MKTRTLYFLLCIPALVQAQDSTTNDLLTTKKFRYGIFQTYKEFKTNSPSIVAGFRIEEDAAIDRCKLFFETGKKIRKGYGFSDGEYLYVNAKLYDQSNYFVRILMLGPILYFEDEPGKRRRLKQHTGLYQYGAVGGLLSGVAISPAMRKNPGMIIYLPDEDGRTYVLDEPSLLSIFEERDTELFKKYEKEKKRRQFNVLMSYVVQFNERRRAEK